MLEDADAIETGLRSVLLDPERAVELDVQGAVEAGVLVPVFVEEGELHVVFTLRRDDLRRHPGEISFPGGRRDPEDHDLLATALREAREEIGLDPRFVTVIGYLRDHILVSGFRITPVVSFVRPGFELLLDAGEVQDTFEVPLGFVFDPANHRMRRRRFGFGETELELCDIPYGDRNIWGATAGMLLTLYHLLQETKTDERS